MRNSDVSFLRRQVLPILERAGAISDEARAAHEELCDRIGSTGDDPTPPVFELTDVSPVDVTPLRFAVGGVEVPYIEAVRGNDGRISLVLDHRLGITTTEDELGRWAWFLANAMAVAGGRTSHGANSWLRNPHGMSGAGGIVAGTV